MTPSICYISNNKRKVSFAVLWLCNWKKRKYFFALVNTNAWKENCEWDVGFVVAKKLIFWIPIWEFTWLLRSLLHCEMYFLSFIPFLHTPVWRDMFVLWAWSKNERKSNLCGKYWKERWKRKTFRLIDQNFFPKKSVQSMHAFLYIARFSD